MGSLELVYKIIYSHAKNGNEVHWHNEESPALLKEVIGLLHGSGNALDIGCGTGVNSVFMAQCGFKVTAIDFVPRALEFARKRATGSGVRIDFIRSDVTEFNGREKFDLILDCGCLHSFDDRKRLEYKKKILELMSVRCQYVLLHAGKKNKSDFGLGPKPKTRAELEQFFMPQLSLIDFIPDSSDVPFHQYRFVKNQLVPTRGSHQDSETNRRTPFV